jgi:primase-polymerase (primpol)-like protein
MIIPSSEPAGNTHAKTKQELEACPDKPPVLPVLPCGVPDAMLPFRHYVTWRLGWSDRRRAWTKLPTNARGPFGAARQWPAKSDDPKTWAPFLTAWEHYRESCVDGIGFVFGDDDPFTGIDLDNAINPATGRLYPWAQKIVDLLDSYTEISPSKTGVKIFVEADAPGPFHVRQHPDARPGGKVEIYSTHKFFAMTGHRLDGCPATVNGRQEQLNALYAHVFPAPRVCVQSRANQPGGHLTPDAATALRLRACVHRLGDKELIAKAESSQNGAKFARLWAGKWQGFYPSHSDADLALCSLLAFWAGPDPERIDALFRKSKLMRSKWDEKRGGTTYGAMTVAKALEGRTDFYTSRGGGSRKPGRRGGFTTKARVSL